MMLYKPTAKLIAVGAFAVMAACSESNNSTVDQQSTPATVSDKTTVATSPGKPSAPINFRYEVQGTPLVGYPVSVNIFVTSSLTGAPINLFYRVTDASSMIFPQSQSLEAQFTMAPGDEPRAQQITVIPQREGRLYLNVSAEIDMGGDTMLKTTSIPIQVGSAPPELKSNGELVETPEGETVISMPASQSD